MATFLDISVLGHIRVVFVAILIFCIIYAVILQTKILGENKAIITWIALSMALMFSLVSSTTKMLDIIIPAFVMLIIFGFVISVAFVFMGGKATDIPSIFGDSPKTMGYWVLIFTIIVFLAGLGKVFFDPSSGSVVVNKNVTASDGSIIEAGSGDAIGGVGEAAFWDTLFHPKVLGFIVIMIVATFTVMYMTKMQ
jgi:hypothetical protein